MRAGLKHKYGLALWVRLKQPCMMEQCWTHESGAWGQHGGPCECRLASQMNVWVTGTRGGRTLSVTAAPACVRGLKV